MTIDLDFEAFMRYGQLGPLILGCSQNAVLDALGQPDYLSVKGLPMILKYKNLQLTFNKNNELAMIVFSFGSNVQEWHHSIHNVGKEPFPGMSFEVFRATYDALSEQFEVNKKLTFDDQITLTIKQSGVDAVFINGKLEKVVSSSLERLKR